MTDEEALKLQDTIGSALRVFAGVEQSLGYVDESSSDYHMSHMLADVMREEIMKVMKAFPESWKEEIIVF